MSMRPPSSQLLLVLLLGSAAMMVAAVTNLRHLDAGRTLAMAGGGTLAAIGGFKIGRLLASGQLFAGRICRSCNARRRTTAAFCESCHRRD